MLEGSGLVVAFKWYEVPYIDPRGAMTYQEYEQLSGPEQLYTVSRTGVMLMHRHTKEGTHVHYRMRNFIVEVLFVGDSGTSIEITSFTMGYSRFLELLCLLPAASLRSICARGEASRHSFQWN